MKTLIRFFALVLCFLIIVINPGILYSWNASEPPLSYSLFVASGLNNPVQMDFDSDGNLYVADSSNNRIAKYNSSGSFITSFGTAFSGPTGVAVDSSGNILVANFQQDKIEKFTNNGVLISTFGSTGSGNNQFSGPYGIALDSGGNIYVADSFNNRIQKFNSSFTYLSTITGSGSAFSSPEAVAIDGSDRIYVLDSGNNRVQVFDSSGTFIRTTTGNGGAWNFPEGMIVDSEGNLYVSDSANDRIQIFDSNGNFGQTFGSAGTGVGEFQYATGLTLDSTGNLYIADQNRVQKATFDKSNPSLSVSNPPGSFVTTGDYSFNGTTTDALTNISSVQYNLNSSGWTTCTANDGAFNSLSESFVCQVAIYTLGSNSLSIRSSDSDSNTPVLTYNFDVGAPPSGPPPPSTPQTPPSSSPFIYDSTSTSTSITLLFSPAGEPVTGYLLFYGEDPTNLDFGTQPFGNSSTVSYTVNSLSPGTTYHFQLTPLNGSTTGPSSTFAANTSGGGLATPSPLPSITPTPLTPQQEQNNDSQISNDTNTIETDENFTVHVTDLFGNDLENIGVEIVFQATGQIVSEEKTDINGNLFLRTVPGNYTANTSFKNEDYSLDFTILSGQTISNVRVPIIVTPIGQTQIISPKEATQITETSSVVVTGGAATTLAVGSVSTGAISLRTLLSLYSQIGRSFLNLPFDLVKTVGAWQFESGLYVMGSMFSGLPFIKRRRARTDGVVFDSATTTPLPLTMLLFYSDSGNLKTVFTDGNGKYSVTPKPDSYNIRAEKPNFLFPSKIFTSPYSQKYGKVYLVGEKVEVSDNSPEIRNISVALDPKNLTGIKLLSVKVSQGVSNSIAKSHGVVFLTGSLISGYAAAFDPTLSNIVVFAVLASIIILKLIGKIYSKFFTED